MLAAVRKVDGGIFTTETFNGSLVMLVGIGYLGEAGYINATLGFIVGIAGWIHILYEIFSGEAGKAAAEVVTKH